MLNLAQLKKMQSTDIMSCDPSSLVDLRNISIDTGKPIKDRIEGFIHQVHNPYLFKVDDVVIKVNYRNGKTITEAMACVLTQG